MSIVPPTSLTPGTVGLWLEFDASLPKPWAGDARIRHARGLVTGLDAITAVETILLPCLPADLETMTRLFTDAVRPGRLLSDKLRLVSAGREPPVRTAVIAWAERRRDGCRDRLGSLGASGSPSSWRAALGQLGPETPGRPLAATRRIFKLAKLALRLKAAEAILAVARRLPTSQASAVADLRRRRLRATWIVLPAVTASARRLPGRKILDVGGDTPDRGPALATLARAVVAVVAPSQHAADRVGGVLAGRPCHVIPPVPLPVAVEPMSEVDSRRRLGDDLRTLYMGSEGTPLHRHFCDFPFERVEYLVAAAPRGDPHPLLRGYAAILRRHRRNLKLLIDGRLPRSEGKFDDVAILGLSFDVAEAAGLGEAARARLLRHARAVIVADGDTGCLPAVFGEAVAAGTPVVMSRMAAVQEVLTPAELSRAEYFDVAGGADGLVAAILHALDHREAVRARQQAIVARVASRTWADVASEMLLRTAPG